ncbi:MAG: carbamoyl phosphate synthase small subunit, partial [Syntrophomonadaceae bacterium]|nr:carbamoyl phosphate synthase small subunit [Syntrophomonadaceae bacterium]
IRSEGTMGGVISDNLDDLPYLTAKAAAVDLKGDQVKYVSRKNIMRYGNGGCRIVMLDLGSKRGVLDSFLQRGCELIAVPASTGADEILALEPHGVYISDGPGDPREVPYAMETVRALAESRPLFGVGLGHQIIAQALGADIVKLEHGHRGSNHPVRDPARKRVYITTQNHSYAVDEDSVAGTELQVTLRSLNDGSVEGIRHKRLPIASVQFDPEGYVGYSDTGFFFTEFLQACRPPSS